LYTLRRLAPLSLLDADIIINRFVRSVSIDDRNKAENIAVALTSFNIYVPLQPLGKFNIDSLTSSLIPAGLVAIGISAIAIVLIFILGKSGEAEKAT
jgi:hypothetical protein